MAAPSVAAGVGESTTVVIFDTYGLTARAELPVTRGGQTRTAARGEPFVGIIWTRGGGVL
jgi:hypothetical protein